MMNIFQGDNIEDVDHNGVIPRSSIFLRPQDGRTV